MMEVICFGQNPIPNCTHGRIERIESLESKYITARNIDIWLPPNYNIKNKYAVLYMQDGQMLFDKSITWNKQSWEIDSIAAQLNLDNNIKEFIVVGVWNDGAFRHQDYFPNNPYSLLSKEDQKTFKTQLNDRSFNPQGDNYLQFIVEELKPIIERRYSVSKKRKDNFIAGSSMGALISIYALFEYPKVFGGAACLSTHWTGSFTTENNRFPMAMLQYMDEKLRKLKSKNIYFDCGDQELDSLYPPIQNRVDYLFENNKFKSIKYLSKLYPGEGHNENAWKNRLQTPLIFLLSK